MPGSPAFTSLLNDLAGVRLRVGPASAAEVAPRLALRAVDPAEDHEVARVQARELGRVDHAHVAQPGIESLSRLTRGGCPPSALRDRGEDDRPAVLARRPLDELVRRWRRRRRRLDGRRLRCRRQRRRAGVQGGGDAGPVPVPAGTDVPVSARVFVADEPLSWLARIASAAPSAAMISAPSTGQTQSPGYQGTRRRQAVASTGMSPAVTRQAQAALEAVLLVRLVRRPAARAVAAFSADRWWRRCVPRAEGEARAGRPLSPPRDRPTAAPPLALPLGTSSARRPG